MIRRQKITIDFETRSEADLRAVGTWNYSKHPSTEVMCLSWRFGAESGHWHMHHGYKIAQLVERAKKAKARSKHALAEQFLKDAKDLMGSPPPARLFELIAEGHEVEAHNVFFERCIWQHVCVERMDWPGVKEEQWRCSAAKASMHALPRDLERATGEMCPDNAKDMEGRRVMLKLSKPAPPTKAEPGRKWHEEPDDLRTLWAYCDQDVVSEEALSESLVDLPPYELELWQMDQRMNLRGFYCDFDLARKAIDLSTELTEELSGVLSTMTHGEINKPSQRAVIKDWLNARLREHGGVDGDEEIITGTGAPVLKRLLIEDPTLRGTDLHKVVGIVQAANRTSIKKYQAMLDRADPVDQRIRDMMMYHGAGTGRWSGKGVQPHNFPRGFLKNMEAACDVLLGLDLGGLRLCYSTEELLDLLSWALRGALMAPEGRQLYVADYAAIEARVLLWLAGDERALDVFRQGKDIYIDMATDIYSMAYEDIKKDSEHRRMGKQAILGLGYQMGAPKFWDTAAGYEPHYKNLDQEALKHYQEDGFMMMEGERILGFMKGVAKHKSEKLFDKLRFGQDLNEAEEKDFFGAAKRVGREMALNVHYFMFFRKVVNKYRNRYPKVKEMWNNQNGCAIAAVQHPGESFEASRVEWVYDKEREFLTCALPSGRLLYYRRPELGKNKFGKMSLYYWSIDPVNKQWRRTGTYGGKLTENITQAVARDLMADAMLRIDRGDTYDLLASVHDELICEADIGKGDVKEFEELMSACPDWAKGCPVKAEGWRGLRYRK